MSALGGAEEEMSIHRSAYIKPPENISSAIDKAIGVHIPGPLNTILKNGIVLKEKRNVSCEELIDVFVNEGGYFQKNKKGLLTFEEVWLNNGIKYYGDVAKSTLNLNINQHTGHSLFRYHEFCTPILEMEQGFPVNLRNAVMSSRARAVKSAGVGGSVSVANTHYNISIENIPWEVWTNLYFTVGPAYALLMFSDNRRFDTWLYKNTEKRMEFRAPAIMQPEKIEAMAAFLAGTMNNIKRDSHVPLWVEMNEKMKIGLPGKRNDFCFQMIENGSDFEIPILKKGPDAILRTSEGTMTARRYYREYLDAFRDDIEAVSTQKQMDTLDGLASGEPFEIEQKPSHRIDAAYIENSTGKTVDEAIADFQPRGISAFFASAVKRPFIEAGNYAIKTTNIGWNKITYEILYRGNHHDTRSVPLENMGWFLKGGEVVEEKLIEYLL